MIKFTYSIILHYIAGATIRASAATLNGWFQKIFQGDWVPLHAIFKGVPFG